MYKKLLRIRMVNDGQGNNLVAYVKSLKDDSFKYVKISGNRRNITLLICIDNTVKEGDIRINKANRRSTGLISGDKTWCMFMENHMNFMLTEVIFLVREIKIKNKKESVVECDLFNTFENVILFDGLIFKLHFKENYYSVQIIVITVEGSSGVEGIFTNKTKFELKIIQKKGGKKM